MAGCDSCGGAFVLLKMLKPVCSVVWWRKRLVLGLIGPEACVFASAVGN